MSLAPIAHFSGAERAILTIGAHQAEAEQKKQNATRGWRLLDVALG